MTGVGKSRTTTSGIIRVGVSGWTYAPWRGVFYPRGLKRELELDYAAGLFRSIELNDTFYGPQRPDAFAAWAAQVPANFVFAVKAPRLITHVRRLRDIEAPVADFLASGLLRLDINLGPIVWQLPMDFRFDPARIEPFLRLLPHDTDAAAALGRKHGASLRSPPGLSVAASRPVRHALDARHASFRNSRFIELLRAHDVALVCAETAQSSCLMDVTADFVYCRLPTSNQLPTGGYDATSIDTWVNRIQAWARGDEAPDGTRVGVLARRRKRDVFVFFDHGRKVSAPADAMALIRRLRG